MNYNRWARTDRPFDRTIALLCLLAASGLFLVNLGGVPLRDWDEGTVAQVAREISRSTSLEGWLYPQLWGEPYLNKPPLLHWCIALVYRIGGVNEWTARLPGALLTAFSVPLLYTLARSLFATRLPAIMGTLVYLTLLPVVRHGRLAMLDGAVVCFLLVMVIAALRSRQDLRWCFGIGAGFGLICLTKSILGVLLLAIVLLFLAWDTPRLLRSPHLWISLVLGSLPVALWYGAQWQHYGSLTAGSTALMATWNQQLLQRVWTSVEGHRGPPWYYLLELLKYSWPWSLFWPWGWQHVWHDRYLSWAKLLLVWTIGYLLTISVMGTKLPWYIFPLYPAIALTVGVALAKAWNASGGLGGQRYTPQLVPTFWIGSLAFLTIVSWIGSLYFSPLGPERSIMGQLSLTFVALGLTFSTVLAHHQNAQFITVLAWGWYVGLGLFMSSNFWVWELGEDYPVKPVAALIREHTPAEAIIYTSHPHGRPSLNFYSDRHIVARGFEDLRPLLAQSQPQYFLLQTHQIDNFNLEETTLQRLGQVADWSLYRNTVDPPSNSH